MTTEEQKVMDKLVDFWNELTKLRPVHADEFNIYRFHYHAIQAQLIARGYLIEQLDKSPQGHLPVAPSTPRKFLDIDTSTNATIKIP